MAKRKERIGDTDQFLNIKSILGSENYGKAQKVIITFFGCGSINSNLAYALVGCGFSKLILIDADKISSRNIPLSSPYSIEDMGKNKAQVLKEKLVGKFPTIHVTAYDLWDYQIPESVVEQSDIIVIGVDNNSTRERINQLCIKYQKPIINLGFYSWEAAFTLFIPKITACWSCLFRPSSRDYEQVQKLQAIHQCPEPEPNVPGGILKATIDRLVGFAAIQILKYFTDVGHLVQYYHFDIRTEDIDIRFLDSTNFLQPDTNCPVCQKKEMKELSQLR